MVADTLDAVPPSRRFGPWRRELRSFLELFALAGVAIAQPTLDLLGKNPSLFIVWRTDALRFFALVLLLIAAPPLGLWLVEVAIGAVLPRARRIVHAALVALLVATIVVEVVKKATELGPTAIVLLALGLGIGGAILVLRFQLVGVWLRFLAIAPVIFALLFVFASPATPVVFLSAPENAKVTVENPNRLVMIVMDEFPLESLLDGKGAIDAQLYPNLAALAAQSTWYRNDTTVAPYTEVAVPAILTGQLPEKPHALAAAATYPENLFTILDSKYGLNVHESVTALCPKSRCPNATAGASARSGFQRTLTDTVKIWRDFAQPERTPALSFDGLHASSNSAFRTGKRFVRSLQPTNEPRFDFLHVLLPHFPWHYLASGQAYNAAADHDIGFDGEEWTSDWNARSGRQRHLLQVQAADTHVGSVVARLRKIGE